MGNGQSQYHSLPKYDWIWMSNNTGIDLYKRQPDGLIAQRRTISLDNRYTLQSQLQLYQLRSQNNYGFVKVYQVDGVQNPQKNKSKGGVCSCTESTMLNVYTQRIQFRLSDLPQLSFPQSLHLLRQCLNSFQQIYQKFGPLHVNSELIGLNQESKIRVWVNENWALNHPRHHISTLLTVSNINMPAQLRDEREMVTNILQVIEQKTQNGRYPIQFSKGIYPNANTFRQAKRYIDKFIHDDFNDQIPNLIKRSRVLADKQRAVNYPEYHQKQTVNPSNLHINQPNPPHFLQGNNLRIVESMYQPMNQNAYPLSYPNQTHINPSPANLQSFKQHKTTVSSFEPPALLTKNEHQSTKIQFSTSQPTVNYQNIPIRQYNLNNHHQIPHFINSPVQSITSNQTQPSKYIQTTPSSITPATITNYHQTQLLANSQLISTPTFTQIKPQTNNHQFLKFKLFNQESTYPKTYQYQSSQIANRFQPNEIKTYSPLPQTQYSSPIAALNINKQPLFQTQTQNNKPEDQLQKIRKLLRQNVAESSQHKSQYRVINQTQNTVPLQTK